MSEEANLKAPDLVVTVPDISRVVAPLDISVGLSVPIPTLPLVSITILVSLSILKIISLLATAFALSEKNPIVLLEANISQVLVVLPSSNFNWYPSFLTCKAFCGLSVPIPTLPPITKNSSVSNRVSAVFTI